jgi:hypothetical protein
VPCRFARIERQQRPAIEPPVDPRMWIETAGAAFWAVPDGRLFSDAVRRAEAYLSAETDPVAAAEAMHRLGILHLDPWISGRSSANYQNELRIWRQRLTDTYGPSLATDPATALPQPVDALNTAVVWLRRAAPNRSGVARGRTLKALAEALVWRELAGGKADRDGIRQCANGRSCSCRQAATTTISWC